MENKKKFLLAYENLTPLQAFCFANEVSFQINLRLQNNPLTQPSRLEPADVAFSINQAFEIMALSLLDYDMPPNSAEEDSKHNVTQLRKA